MNPTQQNARKILTKLKKSYPDAKCSLEHVSPLELLVSTILSAQCTDKRVNIVTKDLFRKYKCAKDYVDISTQELENDIRSTGFYRNKAKNIQAACHILIEKYGGTVPDNIDDLVTLPGVGRKTANVVLGNGFNVVSGIVVDTHVSRLSRRLGLSEQKTPEKIEQDLITLFPKKEWVDLSHRLIHLGREYCTARKPKCELCPMVDICPKIGVMTMD